ncbi:putative RNA-directed DNA polymerase, partial [Tanacetum coccineum]
LAHDIYGEGHQKQPNIHQIGITDSVYFTKLRGLWDEIESVLPAPRCTCKKCSCEMGKKMNELREKEKLYQFLMCLDTEFAVIKTEILAMNPIPTLGNAYYLVAEEERQRTISGEKKAPPESAAFKAYKAVRRENNEQCHSFLKHFAKNDVKDGSVRMANMAGKRDWDSDWVVDSGSTEHITPDETIFDNNFFCSNEEPVVIPNGDAIHKRSTPMRLLNGGRRAMMTTGNTWHKRLGHASEDKLVAIDFLRPNILEVDALEPFNKPICDEIKNHMKLVNEPNELNGTNDANEHNVNPTKNENEAEDILSETSGPPEDTTKSNEAQPDIPQLTRVKRNRSQPTHLSDYHVKLPPSVDHAKPASSEASSTVHPLSNFVSYEKFSGSHKAFLAAITSGNEPKNFNQVARDKRWKEAMKKEIRALEENDTWMLVDLPNGKRAVDSKWVYKIKYKPNGVVERFKSRLVAKGFTQMEGVDYNDTFAPVAKLVTVRTLLALLNKSLYGLKQTSRNWYQKFTSSLLELGFKQCKADYSLFIFKKDACFVAALIYVDDVIMVGNEVKKIQHTKEELDKCFSNKNLGVLKYFLGIEVARTPEGLVLSQRKYIMDILKDCGFQGGRPSRLLYLQATRPDIAYFVNVLSQFVADPRHSHIDAAHQVLRYLKGTAGQGILLPQDGGCNLTAYCDSDWLGCLIR